MKIFVHKSNKTENWDKELLNRNGSIFMSKGWLSAVSSANLKPVFFYFLADDSNVAMIGGLERTFENKPGKQLFFYSGIASSRIEESFLKNCKNELLQYAHKHCYLRIIIKSYDFNNYIAARHKCLKVFHRSEYLLDLNKETDLIIKGFDPEVRRRARKARREGIVFRVTYSKDVLEELLKLINVTKEVRESKGYGSFRPISLPFLDRRVIENLLAERQARLFYAEDHMGILGVQLLTYNLGKAYGLLMGIAKRGYKRAIPSFLAYEGTMFLKEEGFYYYNFGPIPLGRTNQGLRKFKESLGAKIIESVEESTDFLSPGLYYLNPLMKLKRFLHKIRMPWRLKKFILRNLDFIISGRDKY